MPGQIYERTGPRPLHMDEVGKMRPPARPRRGLPYTASTTIPVRHDPPRSFHRRTSTNKSTMNKLTPPYLLKDFADQDGISIHAHSHNGPFVLVLLRHMGCSFCRRTLDEIQRSLDLLRECGYHLGIVHMNASDQTLPQLEKYNLGTLPRFYDPERLLYQNLGLDRLGIKDLFRTRTLAHGVKAAVRYQGSWPTADARQLPGAFLIENGHVVAGERVMYAEDQPDILSLLIYSEALKDR